jgi:hypothetical protein
MLGASQTYGPFPPEHVQPPEQAEADPSLYAVHALKASAEASIVPASVQSYQLWPRPSECVASQLVPQHPGVLHAHPAVFGAVVLHMVHPAWHPVYEQVVPVAQPAPKLWVVSQVIPQPEQFVGESSGVSQPFMSGAAASQLPHPVVHFE